MHEQKKTYEKYNTTDNPRVAHPGCDAADGAGLYEAAIPLLQNTKANIEADITPLVNAIMVYGSGKAELTKRMVVTMTTPSLIHWGRQRRPTPFLNSNANAVHPPISLLWARRFLRRAWRRPRALGFSGRWKVPRQQKTIQTN